MHQHCRNCESGTNSRFCSNSCQQEHQHKAYIERWLVGAVSGNTAGANPALSRHVRRHLIEQAGYRCQLCQWSEKNPVTGQVPLNVDHKDGNWANSTPGNLIVLCPNCHSLTPTFGNLNRGSGREFRRSGKR